MVAASARLYLSNIRGSVTIQGVDAPGAIVVKAVKYLESGDADRTQIEMTQESGDSARIETHYDKYSLLDFLLRWQMPCKVDYLVQVPRNCDLELKCISSRGLVEGVNGRQILNTVSGSLQLNQLSGDISIDTVSGAVETRQIDGHLRVHSISGELRLLSSQILDCDATSVSGAMYMETSLAKGPYKFNTTSGSVRLGLPQEAHFSVQFQSISGHLHSLLQSNGSGSPLIAFKSISGNLDLEPSRTYTEWEEEPASEIEPEEPPLASTLSRLEILEKIASGEMTTEEGILRLKNAVE